MNSYLSQINELEYQLSEIRNVSGTLADIWNGPAGEVCVSQLRSIASDIGDIIEELKKKSRGNAV